MLKKKKKKKSYTILPKVAGQRKERRGGREEGEDVMWTYGCSNLKHTTNKLAKQQKNNNKKQQTEPYKLKMKWIPAIWSFKNPIAPEGRCQGW